MNEKKNGPPRDCLSPEEFVSLATALSFVLTEGMSVAQIKNLSNFFDLLSTQIAAIATQKSYCKGQGAQLIL